MTGPAVAAPAETQPLRALVYVSSARGAWTEAELQQLLRDARLYNERHDITGFLLHCEGNFMQTIEGPAATVEHVYRRICTDLRHQGLVVVFDGLAASREFAGWAMAYAPAQLHDFVRLAGSRWGQIGRQGSTAGPAQSRSLLREFWVRHRLGVPPGLDAAS